MAADLEHLLRQMNEACSKYLAASDDSERNTYFGMMLGIQGGAYCFLTGGTSNATYIKLDTMVNEAVAKRRGILNKEGGHANEPVGIIQDEKSPQEKRP